MHETRLYSLEIIYDIMWNSLLDIFYVLPKPQKTDFLLMS